MGKLEGNKSKFNCFWLFITLETNCLLIMIVICGLKVLLWETGLSAGQVLEEMELKPTQPPTGLRLGLGLAWQLSRKIFVMVPNCEITKKPIECTHI